MANYERTPGTLESYQIYDDIDAEITGSYNNFLALETADTTHTAAEVYLDILSDRYEYCGFNDDMVDLAIAMELDNEEDVDDSLYIPDIHPFMCGVFFGNRIAHSELGENFDNQLQAALSLPSHVSEATLQHPGDNERLQQSIIADAYEGHEQASAYIPLAIHLFDAFQTREDRVRFGQGFGVVMQKIHLAKQTTC